MTQTFIEFWEDNSKKLIHDIQELCSNAFRMGINYAESHTQVEEPEEPLDEKYIRITNDINTHMDENERPLPTYTLDKYKQFVVDMFENNLEDTLDHYEGRFFYKGPSVTVNLNNSNDLCRVIRSTTVNLQWDTLGKNSLVVYPAY